ncbi:MAG TPA: RNA polymerase factor sigma-54 [Terriglobales bacterium]|jgi:RNA polymerase sigma-54 factor|nr:RNA polymerase factor sigma-54 [Terriglobales bacterium]
MVLLQHRLSLKVSQRQILTPGLVQMVSVLALNKLELKDMINSEMVENPVLEELEDPVPLIDDVGRREEERERPAAEESPVAAAEKKDPFEEIDFGSFFQEYLDPGYRSQGEMEEIERPSFENFLSKPSNLTDYLMWQLGSIPTTREVREAAELIIGNLNEDGYLIATDEELLGVVPPAPPEVDSAKADAVVAEAAALGLEPPEGELPPTIDSELSQGGNEDRIPEASATDWAAAQSTPVTETLPAAVATAVQPSPSDVTSAPAERPPIKSNFDVFALHDALEVVRQLDPPGIACRNLRECLLYQLRFHQRNLDQHKDGIHNGHTAEVISDAIHVVDQHLRALQLKQHKEIGKLLGRPIEAIQAALEFIRTLDPRPGLRYNAVQPRLIEPDVAFVKHGDEWLVIMNDEDLPTLRLNPAYKRLLTKDTNDKDTRNYVKERYKSAIQLIKNIEQRKQTIMKVCYAIVGRQQDFLEKGIDQLKPMMIKEVAEEIGVHPSTVSRAVANKYAHTPQGVFELRYFFSESVNGPEGGATSLLILKRRVKKLIEEEDPTRPLTDEQITRILQSQGIQVTRRTVAKYREDMRIPSTHQRRIKK